MPFIILFIALLLIVAAFILVRTLLFTRISSNELIEFKATVPELEVDAQSAAEHLASVIQIETISYEDPAQNKSQNFHTLQQQLEKMYPRTHAVLSKEVVDGFSLLYTWQGKDKSLDPVAFTAHQDVVPADENTLNQWTYPPFSGRIADGFIWGRGTLDIKSQMIAIFEAIETLINNKYQPERTVLLAFGHDEEVFGNGAKAIVAHLQEKGIRLQAMLDEGGCVYDGVIPGIKGFAATIGVAEKGYLSLKFTVKTAGGHSSMPLPETAIGVLARAIDRLQSHPFPYKIQAILPLFKGLSPAITPLMQIVFANLWLFGGLARRKLSSDAETAASIHTTTAPTIFHSGLKDNVLPSLAEAVVNFRVLPGETIAEVCERVRSVINDERVTFEPLRGNAWEASPVSPTDSTAYRHIVSLNNKFFPDSVSTPYVMLGATDARNYYAVSSQVYRFCPVVMDKEDLERVHGINERLSVEAMGTLVDYFYQLIQRWTDKEM